MELISKNLLINILCILLPLFIFQIIIFLKYVYRIDKKKELSFTILMMTSICLSMLFPISFGGEFIWDLRRIPFIIGILYGGPKVGAMLLPYLLVVRFLLGDITGFYSSAISYTITAMILSLISRKYLGMSLVYKLAMSSLLVLLSTQITFLIAINIGHVMMTPSMWLQYFLINLAGLLVATLIVEMIHMNSDLLGKLVKAEKLEVVSHLAASISHEVRNPLTTSKGFMQLSYNGDVTPEVKQYIGTAIKELDRASDIINDYLTFAKPTPEEVKKLCIYTEIQHVVNILTPLATMNNVKLNVKLGGNAPMYILVDRKKLEQSLINIVKNGIESMSEGGNLSIHTTSEFPSIKIIIRDEGRGMTQHQINRLGEPYFTTKENGTGLGMMVSYSIIQGMGGKINVRSNVGNWTSFSIEFPMA